MHLGLLLDYGYDGSGRFSLSSHFMTSLKHISVFTCTRYTFEEIQKLSNRLACKQNPFASLATIILPGWSSGLRLLLALCVYIQSKFLDQSLILEGVNTGVRLLLLEKKARKVHSETPTTPSPEFLEIFIALSIVQ